MANSDNGDLSETLRRFTFSQSWDEVRDWLTRHPELLGDESVQLLTTIKERVRQSGDDKSTRFFQRYYDLLVRARAIGVEPAISEGRAAGQTLSPRVRTLLSELQQLQTSRTDPRRRIQLIQEALLLIGREHNAALWGALQGMLGESLSEAAAADGIESDYERAIDAYEQSAAVLTRDSNPVEWGNTMVELAALFARRQKGDRVENLDRALNAFRRAISVFTGGVTVATIEPESQENLLALAAGTQSDLERAIETLRKMLRLMG